ncbi:DedA family protein, partial [Salmonella enterica]|uniref:DedA family protein n=1 Tax=Salmonella enterica TaxID=28901 RepID=UPI00398C296C
MISSMSEGVGGTVAGGVGGAYGVVEFGLGEAGVGLGGMLGVQVLYLVGRCYGGQCLSSFPRSHTKIRRAQKMIQRHPTLFVIGTRFMYGFRLVGPLSSCARPLPPKLFLPRVMLGPLLRALLLPPLGDLLGA